MQFLSPGGTLTGLAIPYWTLDLGNLWCRLLGFVIFLQIVLFLVWHQVPWYQVTL